MKKQLISCLLLGSLTLIGGTVTNASPDVSLAVNGGRYIVNEDNPAAFINQDDRTMVPIRFVSTQLGVADEDVIWDGDRRSVTIKHNGNVYFLEVGTGLLGINGTATYMDTVTSMSGGRVYIPVRYIAELFGQNVEFDDASRTVHIMSDKDNNFARYGITKTSDFPMTETAGGVALTIKNAYIYPVGSPEELAARKKFNLAVDDNNLMFKIDYTFINNTNKVIGRYDTATMANHFDIFLPNGGHAGLASTYSESVAFKMGGNDFTCMFRVEPGTSYDSTIYLYGKVNDLSYVNFSYAERGLGIFMNIAKDME